MLAEPILRVAIPAPLRHALDYLPPAGVGAGAIGPGMRVVVPLGPRRVLGVITEVITHSELAPGKLRRALALPDATPLVPPELLALCTFAARYYHAPPGEVIVNTLPVQLRSVARAPRRAARRWQATTESFGLHDAALARAPKQAAALGFLQRHGPADDAACRAAGIDATTLRALQRKGLSVAAPAGDSTTVVAPVLPGSTAAPALNAAQQSALAALEQACGAFHCALLEGVTGSGKTEVYLRFIERVLAGGRQALVLVPEIGLTPQTRQRFEARFGQGIAVLHSGLGDRERLDTWHRCADGRARVLIGTRSALFSPLPELGAIIVDEEHDASFKQQEGFRYSARDLAVVRARQAGVPVVLGSATPSTESLANCASGRFLHLRLPERAGAAQSPAVRLLDVKGQALEGGMCAETIARIGEELAAGNQALVFLNRRGWAPVLSCADCGWMGECRHCDARMTLHRAERLLWCHHCDARSPVPSACPHCRSARLVALGTGTERTEHTLQRLFPAFPIRRIDRGTMQARDAMEQLIRQLGSGEPCILVGTQMLAKGHHFPHVTLVAIIDLDGGLFSADFRAAERTGQLLVQVAGRAGRAERPGEVLVQTFHPEHPWLTRLVDGGYATFIEPILAERRRHGLPPYAHLAILRAESREQQAALALLQKLKRELLREHHAVEIIGPVPAPMQRRAGFHRLQLLLSHAQRAPLHAALEAACRLLETRRTPGVERWHIDVDPQEGA
ncbi:MAG: primosomal protein N' [Pseudomonadales bacterium]|nr:primosomal protein N' [Pseudomonadales bacterium]